jgi:hypothetical protein
MLFFFQPGLRIRHDLRASRRPSLLMLASTSPLALVPTATGAIVTRHDVPASAYIAKPADLPSYCRMLAPDGGGALISRYWVLTAAHLAPVIKPGQRIVCGAESLIVASIVVHPKYQETVGRHDLALVRLAQAAAVASQLSLRWPKRNSVGLCEEGCPPCGCPFLIRC